MARRCRTSAFFYSGRSAYAINGSGLRVLSAGTSRSSREPIPFIQVLVRREPGPPFGTGELDTMALPSLRALTPCRVLGGTIATHPACASWVSSAMVTSSSPSTTVQTSSSVERPRTRRPRIRKHPLSWSTTRRCICSLVLVLHAQRCREPARSVGASV